MPSMKQVAVASALLALGSAAPTEKRSALAEGFSITQVRNPNFKRTIPNTVGRTYAKWAQASGSQTGSVVATPQPNDVEYLCPVKIGTQTFNLDFDTGSSDTWVFGTKVTGSSVAHTYYSPGSTAKLQSGSTWNISYGDGSSASGIVYLDTVDIGGVTVTGQAVEVATVASSEFLSDAADGLVGLAFDSINTVSPKPVDTFVTNAKAQGMAGIVVANLKAGEPGTYDFGYVDASYGTISYTPVTSSGGFWAFSPSSIKIGSTSYSLTSDTGNAQPIADTGTTLMVVDTKIATAYWKSVSSAKVQSDGSYIFSCSDASKLQDLSVVIGDYTAVVPAADFNLGTAEGMTAGQCLGGIQGNADLESLNIFGDVFLKSQIVVFDQSGSTPRLGFAPKPSGTVAGPTTTTAAAATTTEAAATTTEAAGATTTEFSGASTTEFASPTTTTKNHKHHKTTTAAAASSTAVDCDQEWWDPSCFQ